jgi:hypothetical protein
MSKNKSRIYLNFLLYVVILLTLVACSSQTSDEISPDLRDEEWQNRNACAGCWHGLKIGETSKKDSLSFVQNLSFVGKATGFGDFFCKKPADTYCVVMMFAR